MNSAFFLLTLNLKILLKPLLFILTLASPLKGIMICVHFLCA